MDDSKNTGIPRTYLYIDLVTDHSQKGFKTIHSENLSESKPKYLTQVRNRKQKLERWKEEEFLNSLEAMEHKI